MKNQVGREIPDEILARMGKTGYRGLHDRDNASYRKASPTVRALNDPQRGKLCASLREALEKCELHDGMYFGFHHHFRDGDYVINMVMQEVARMGIRDITICATSMGAAHDALEPLIEQGVIAGIQSSGVRGKIGEAISKGKFKKPAIIRSHGGRRKERLRRAVLFDGGRQICGSGRGDYGLPRALPEHARQHFHDGCGLRVRG